MAAELPAMAAVVTAAGEDTAAELWLELATRSESEAGATDDEDVITGLAELCREQINTYLLFVFYERVE